MKNNFIGINTRRVLTRIRKAQNYFIARKYKNSLQEPIRHEEDYEWHIIDKGITQKNFIYQDENWNNVKYMESIGIAEWLGYSEIPVKDNFPKTNRVNFKNANVSIRSEELSEFRWVILKYYKPLGDIFAVEFTARIESVFTELQFAVNWESITTRDRFQIIDNRLLIFQNVLKGAFLPRLLEKPVSLRFDKPTHFRIVVMEETYSITIDKQLKMSFALPARPIVDTGKFAFIFFEKTSTRKILAELDDVSISIGERR